MKKSTPLQPHRTAFTLIELLTVIAIIAVLMGLLFPAIAAVKEAARKTQAKNDVSQSANAVKAFFTEYGKYPLTDTQVTAAAGSPGADTVVGNGIVANNVLYNILRSLPGADTDGATPAGNRYNPRHIIFFEGSNVKDASNPRGGFATQGASGVSTGDYVDPWGHPYLIFIDSNYDNKIDMLTIYTDWNTNPVRAGAGAASFGKDGMAGTKGNHIYLNSDDVISWQ